MSTSRLNKKRKRNVENHPHLKAAESPNKIRKLSMYSVYPIYEAHINTYPERPMCSYKFTNVKGQQQYLKAIKSEISSYTTKRQPSMKRKKMIGKINVIILDLKLNDKPFEEYFKLTAEQQIAILADNISRIASELEDKSPGNMNIFAWREYGITEKKSRFISIAQKEKLKQAVTQHPNWTTQTRLNWTTLNR